MNPMDLSCARRFPSQNCIFGPTVWGGGSEKFGEVRRSSEKFGEVQRYIYTHKSMYISLPPRRPLESCTRQIVGPKIHSFEENLLAPDKSIGFIWTPPTAELSQKMFFETASSRLAPQGGFSGAREAGLGPPRAPRRGWTAAPAQVLQGLTKRRRTSRPPERSDPRGLTERPVPGGGGGITGPGPFSASQGARRGACLERSSALAVSKKTSFATILQSEVSR